MRGAKRRPDPPGWLVHPLRWQRLPMPWAAMARGVLGMGPVLALAVATGHGQAGVLAGLGAMFAGINDRPGTWRTGLRQIGVPALAGALGLLIGQPAGWWVLPLLGAVGLVSGAISVAGPVSSAAAVQLLVLTIIGSGMPLALPVRARIGWFLAGAFWLLLLHAACAVRGRHSGERLAVAAVFDALAEALDAVGTQGAEAARRRLTVVLDKADDALRLHQLLRRPGPPRAGEQRLTDRFTAAAALCEASVALLWEGERLPPRLSSGPRRLAAAVRADANPGRLPVPVPDSAARSAFDRAVLQACLAFGSAGGTVQPPPGSTFVRRRRGVHPLGPAGREYGLRVAVCVTASAAVALLLRADHAYWLPATAAFLVKPDLGPLFSRVVNRFVGTGAAVLLFALVAGVPGGPWSPVALAAGCGALIPPAARHFALQTAVVTLTVLGFVSVGGDTQAAGVRLADTAIACAIVLLVGHLPGLADTRARVGHRCAHALRHTLDYLEYVLTDGQDEQQHPERRADLRRAAYHCLSEARAAAGSAAAELTTGVQRDWLGVAAGAERIADATTACAVRMEHGAPRPAEPTARQVTEALAAVADALDGRGPAAPELGPAAPNCRTLDDILIELHRIQALAVTAA